MDTKFELISTLYHIMDVIQTYKSDNPSKIYYAFSDTEWKDTKVWNVLKSNWFKMFLEENYGYRVYYGYYEYVDLPTCLAIKEDSSLPCKTVQDFEVIGIYWSKMDRMNNSEDKNKENKWVDLDKVKEE